MRPRVGAICYSENGVLGLVTGQDDAGTWFGKVVSVENCGYDWTARRPRVVAYLDQIAAGFDPLEYGLLRCATCERKMTAAEAANFKHCPTCGGSVAPEFVSQDIFVRMNWAEARMLANWSQGWAIGTKLPSVAHQRLTRIFGKLRLVRPEHAPALLDEEVAEEAQVAEFERSLAGKAVENSGRKEPN